MEIVDMLKASEIIKNGGIEQSDAPLIIAYVKELEKTTSEAVRRADVADMASKKLLKGFEILKQNNFNARDEFEKLKKVLDTNSWDAGQEATFYAFFLHGWNGRTNDGVYQ
jgi:hypothetical protein